MATTSRPPPLPKVGDKLTITDPSYKARGTQVTVYDVDEINKIVLVNYVEGPKKDMVKLGFNLQGMAHGNWPFVPVAPAPKAK